ncbi:MAG TPA: fibronectin type III domain-containing protein [Chitinophagales bacterium]|nr:fibronectin type III domain-containing protein [Chitinophagales bacterium]
MRLLKVKTGPFIDANNEEFVRIFSEIVQAIIAHIVIFTNLPFTVQELNERVQSITAKTNDAVNGSREQKNARDLERTICTNVLLRLKDAVETRAGQEETYEEQVAIVEMAKFSVYKEPQPAGIITPPAPQAKMSNTPGSIILQWRSNKHVKSWIIQHVAGTDVSPNANWEYYATVGRSSFTATGLPTGYHSFRLIALSAAGESEPSEACTEFAK